MDAARDRMALSAETALFAKDDRMTESGTPKTPAAVGAVGSVRTHQVRRHRGGGQWALGHFTPLNPNEQAKKDDDGLNMHGRMRWRGLYTQRRPGIDGGKTAILEPEDLDDEYFMLRVRVDGGCLSVAQLRAISEVSVKYARGTADVTDRQNVQLHWIRIKDVPAIRQILEAVGLETTEACGDVPRVILGSPVAGVSRDEFLDGTPAIEEINERFIGPREFSNLPRKFKTAVSGLQDVVHETNDISFVGVVHPEHGPGFDVWVGGSLSTNPQFAKRLGVWVPLDKVAEGVGSDRIRTTTDQKMLILDVPGDRIESLVGELKELDLQIRPSVFRRYTMACTGIEFCKPAIVEPKALAAQSVDEPEKRLPDFDTPVTINVNGCPNSCARIQVADVGLKGQLVRDADGDQVEGFQVHLGGYYGSDAESASAPGAGDDGAFGRKVRGLKVTAKELPGYVERVLRAYRADRAAGESFAVWTVRATEQQLS